jgi:hypothetical protein
MIKDIEKLLSDLERGELEVSSKFIYNIYIIDCY